MKQILSLVGLHIERAIRRQNVKPTVNEHAPAKKIELSSSQSNGEDFPLDEPTSKEEIHLSINDEEPEVETGEILDNNPISQTDGVRQEKELGDRTEQSILEDEIGSNIDDGEPQIHMKGVQEASFPMRDVYVDTVNPEKGEEEPNDVAMGMKFLNKKGWHTGSLRNIENVWKAEQKHAAEEKKLDELRKQIVEERERSEFRELQEQAGLVPKQERLEFLYDSGLAVGRPGGSDSLKEAFTKAEEPSSSAAAAAKEASASAPGALFAAEKPQSANDAWRKLHSDPLLMIKQREQEALARIKNNPVQMAMIRKQVETKKPKDKERDKKEHRKKHRKESSKHQKQTSDSEDDTADMERRKNSQRKASKYVKRSELEDEPHEIAHRSEKNRVKQSNVEDESRHRARESGKTQAKYSDSEDELRNKERGRGNHVRHSDWEDASHNRAHRSEKKYSDELNNRGHRSEKNRIKHADSEDKLHNTGRSENNRGKRSDVEDVLHNRRSRSENNRGKRSDVEDVLHNRRSRSEKNRGKHSDSEDELHNRRSDKNRGKHSDSEDKLHNRRSRSEKNRGKHSDSEDELHNRRSRSEKNPGKHSDSEDELHNQRSRSEKNGVKHLDSDDGLHKRAPSIENNHAIERAKDDGQGMVKGKHESSEQAKSSIRGQNDTHNRRRFVPPKLSEEERAARLKEMQIDAEFHEEQRWKRLKKADEKDAREATQAIRSGGKNFLDAVQTSVYGSGKGGSSTIEESVRRRTHYSQGRSEAGESNAFRR
ncbi:hypothetical protein ACLB2K_035154 [Fragaria x ananassa]